MAFVFNIIKDEKTTLKIPNLPCQTVYDKETDIYGHKVDPKQKCGCAVCEEGCDPVDWDKILPKSRLFLGFQFRVVYLIAFLVCVIVLASIWADWRKKVKNNREMYSSFDSYDSIKKYL